ncbi:hypothetical protein Nepgr_005753 [Nepenthes gracilis]|uniref:DUF1308 domain-containing protein n=1 Tax=Nepenthes gracilis TaxID=150966 RepID=A0AAD3XGP0_NEPGR|nr:hypothetical protein Nepgr_005753 [Nepenthes gracilis]
MEIEAAKKRCEAVVERISSLPRSKISDSCTRTLLRLVTSELNFLYRLSLSTSRTSSSLSCNIGYIEAIVYIIQQPYITGVSRVCKPIPMSQKFRKGKKNDTESKLVHVDIVCTLQKSPVWIIISDRSPKYISWNGYGRNKSLKLRVEQILAAVESSPVLKPSSIIFFFSNGLDDFVREQLIKQFNFSVFEMELSHFEFTFSEESEGEWVNVLARSYNQACTLILRVGQYLNACSNIDIGVNEPLFSAVGPKVTENQELHLGISFSSLISKMKGCPLDLKYSDSFRTDSLLEEGDLVNFDTTALVAIVSGISNDGAEEILAKPESELRQRFKNNTEFVISQAVSEIKNPIHVEMHCILSGKRGIICESVYSEFMEIVLMCGGPNERSRADVLVKCLKIVPDRPSPRMMSLPTTRKLASKNKVVFGTGDHWAAPTLTANMGFIRAVSQTGMSLFNIQHRPRALIGD